MNGIGGDVSILPAEADLDNNKVVDVFEIVANKILGMLRRTILDNQISSSTDSYLVSNMAWQDELTIVPTDLGLNIIRKALVPQNMWPVHTLFPRM